MHDIINYVCSSASSWGRVVAWSIFRQLTGRSGALSGKLRLIGGIYSLCSVVIGLVGFLINVVFLKIIGLISTRFHLIRLQNALLYLFRLHSHSLVFRSRGYLREVDVAGVQHHWFGVGPTSTLIL